MQRKYLYKLGIAVVVVVVVGISFFSFEMLAQARQDQRVPVRGQVVPLIQHAQMLGAANGQQQLNLSIAFLLPNNSPMNLVQPQSSSSRLRTICAVRV